MGPVSLHQTRLTPAAPVCRLNYRLSESCHDTIATLCPDSCQTEGFEQPCGGTVLRCLTSKLEEITNEDCKKEVGASNAASQQAEHLDCCQACCNMNDDVQQERHSLAW